MLHKNASFTPSLLHVLIIGIGSVVKTAKRVACIWAMNLSAFRPLKPHFLSKMNSHFFIWWKVSLWINQSGGICGERLRPTMSAAEPLFEEIGLVELALPIWQLELVGDLELPLPLLLLQLSPNGTLDPKPDNKEPIVQVTSKIYERLIYFRHKWIIEMKLT